MIAGLLRAYVIGELYGGHMGWGVFGGVLFLRCATLSTSLFTNIPYTMLRSLCHGCTRVIGGS